MAEWTSPLDIEAPIHYRPKFHRGRYLRNRRMRQDPASNRQHPRRNGFERRIYVSTHRHIQLQIINNQLGPNYDNKRYQAPADER